MNNSALEAIKSILEKEYNVKFFRKPTPIMWIIHVFLMIISFGKIRNFMTKFTTTVGNRIYFSSNATISAWSLSKTLAHEGIHLEQQRRDGRLLFALRYLFSRKWRARYEADAYTMSNAFYIWSGIDIASPSSRMVSLFTGPAYMYMNTDKLSVIKTLQEGIDDIRSCSYIDKSQYGSYIRQIKHVLDNRIVTNGHIQI